MAHTNTSYTPSPQRWRTPQRSQARQPSEDGSQYEMDLDALGLNSTFESTELGENHRPKIDVVETSDLEGPEDFTENMTYWMTVDLPVAKQIRSRKEANVRLTELRGDTVEESEGDKATNKDNPGEQTLDTNAPAEAETAPTKENGSRATSEGSMENEEKVRSYLSALPDTDVGTTPLPSTPLRVPKQNMLQVPTPSVVKTRSLQATVEDYDTPRKPTQETVIHHPPQRVIEEERDELRKQVSELQSQLEQQQLTSKMRITELETVLSYTRSDLETARNDTYRQNDQLRDLRDEHEKLRKEAKESRDSMEDQLKKQEEEFGLRMEEFGEELRLQSLARLQDQRDEFEQQLQDQRDEFEQQLDAVESAKRAADEKGEERERLLVRMKSELSQLRTSNDDDFGDWKNAFDIELPTTEQEIFKVHSEMQKQLYTLQLRAQTLQTDLEKATTEARSARQEADQRAAMETSVQATNQALQSHVTNLQSLQESLEEQLEAAHTELDVKNRKLEDSSDVEERLECLQKRLEDSRAEVAGKDKQLLQARNLESQVETLRAQLEVARNDASAKDEQMLQRLEEHTHLEEQLNSARGRVQSLENTVSALRQQLSEAHRNNAKAQADAEQFEQSLEDADDRLQDARAEADRRVADVERKLTKMKDLKLELESKLKDLKSQYDELVEDHEAEMEEVRDRAEDAVRKAGHVLEQERSEKKRIAKDLKRASHDIEQLRAEVAKKALDIEDSDEGLSSFSADVDAKDAEMENLRILLRKQSTQLNSLKSETSTLRKENTRLKTEIHKSILTTETEDLLQTELGSLRRENQKLKTEAKTREEDFEAINKAMDERLASMLSKILKQKAKGVVGKRDGQWVDNIEQAANERDLMSRALMREWGRQEVGVAPEGESQGYKYKYVRRR